MTRTVDTRFFLTHYIADTAELKAKTSQKMVELEREAAVIPTIVIHEVYKLMHNHIGEDAARLRINSITASPFRIVDLTAKIAVASANLRCRYRGLPAADSIIAATSIETGSRRVLSDDPHFKQIHEIMCEWL